MGDLLYETNKYDEAIVHYLKSSSAAKESGGLASWFILSSMAAARAQLMIKEGGIDLESLREATKKNKARMYGGTINRYMGEKLLNLGGQYKTEAEEWIQKAIELDTKLGMRWELGRAHAL